MRRVAFVADIHLGNHRRHGGPVEVGMNRRCRETLAVLRTALDAAVDAGAVFVLGDLFDNDRPNPQVLAAAQEAIDDAPMVLLLGNHDQTSTMEGDHALGPLAPLADVVERPTILSVPAEKPWLEVACVPFAPGVAKDWLPAALDNFVATPRGPGIKARVLALHMGIVDEHTPAYLRDSHGAIPLKTLQKYLVGKKAGGFEAILSGDWHERKIWRTDAGTVMQVGALCPTGWDNPGFDGYGTLAFFDEGGDLYFDEIPGPRFIVAKNAASLMVGADREKEGFNVYARVQTTPGTVREVLAAAETYGLTVVEPEIDKGEMKEAARTAALEARSADNLDAALDGYVAAMPVPDGVDRPAVLARAREYLRL